MGESVATNWLWVIRGNISLLVGWDFHFHGIEVYSVDGFMGVSPVYRKGYVAADPQLAQEIMVAAYKNFAAIIQQTGARAA